MLCVYGHYRYGNLIVRGSVFDVYRRQILTSEVDSRVYIVILDSCCVFLDGKRKSLLKALRDVKHNYIPAD